MGCKFAHYANDKIAKPHQVIQEVAANVDVTELSNSLARTPPRDDTETNAT